MDENDIEFSMDCDQSSPASGTASLNEKSLINTNDLTGNYLLRTIMNKLDKQDEFNGKVLEEMQGIRNELKELRETQKKSVVGPVKKIIQAPIIKQNDLQNKFPISSRKFILRDIFKNMSKTEDQVRISGNYEEYFGLQWNIEIFRMHPNVAFYFKFPTLKNAKKWSNDVDLEFSVSSPKDKFHFQAHPFFCGDVYYNCMPWHYSMGDTLVVEVHVNMKKMNGIYKDNMRSFDESNKDCSDILLIVEDEKFYVAKLFLATHSSYFKTMFLGLFDESKMSEITLTGIYSEDFQKYLEVLYGEPAIDEITVEGILLLGDMYDTEIVVRKCEEFLLKDSKKTLKKKLQMSVRFNLEKLKKKCLSGIKTIEDIQSVIPGDINDLDKTIMAILLEKCLSFK